MECLSKSLVLNLLGSSLY
uniref:Uncharacterized protein n=1 Tax=Salix viminalis TaxID=40686 RepID=A0A6N2KW45_SALVM